MKTLKIITPFLFLFLCACASSGGEPPPVLTFSHLKIVPVNVGALKIENAGNTDSGDFVVSPFETFERYLHARFAPAGYDGMLRAVVEEASVRRAHQAGSLGVTRYLNVAGFDVYDITLKIRLEHADGTGRVLYGSTLVSRRVTRISEHASVAAREQDQVKALEALFRDLDTEVLRVVLGDMRLGK